LAVVGRMAIRERLNL